MCVCVCVYMACVHMRVCVEQQMSPGKGESSDLVVPEGLAGRSSSWGQTGGCTSPVWALPWEFRCPPGDLAPTREIPGSLPLSEVSADHLRQAPPFCAGAPGRVSCGVGSQRAADSQRTTGAWEERSGEVVE